MTGGSHVDVAARLVGLGFQGKAVSILLAGVVFAEVVHGFAKTFYGLVGAGTAGVGFYAFAAAPQHKYLRPKFGPEIHGAHGLLESVSADFGIVGGESS